MALTVEALATEVLAAVDSNAGLVQAGNWISQRYRQLTSRSRFRHLRQVGELVVPAVINAGTLTAARDSNAVTADAAAQAVLSSAIVGQHLRIRRAWYEIASYASPTIMLSSAFSEDSVTGGGYDVVKRFHTLPESVRWFTAFVHMRLWTPLRMCSQAVLNRNYPNRHLITSFPTYWSELGSAGGTQKMIEVYPYTTSSEIIHYVYWQAPAVLALTDDIPGHIDPGSLREGALVDLFRFKAAQAADAGNVELAAFWRNESNSQRTEWERLILRSIKADRGVDDITFVLQNRSSAFGDITNARDEVFARGNRP